MCDYIMLRTQISLTEEHRAVLDAEAARTGKSISALIRDAVIHTYGSQADVNADIAAIEAAIGAWQDRGFDGAEYVKGLRSAGRLKQVNNQ